MMNVIDYLIGNVDRHWGNWGFTVDNKTNKLGKLYPLMDFNKAFLSYDTIDGALCQTTDRRISQKQAAIEAVQKVGLNQVKDVIDGKNVIGPQREIQEVKNAYNAYEMINDVNPYSISDLKKYIV